MWIRRRIGDDFDTARMGCGDSERATETGLVAEGLSRAGRDSGPMLSKIENGTEPKNASKAIARIASFLKIDEEGKDVSGSIKF